jgi:hypothetical protein
MLPLVLRRPWCWVVGHRVRAKEVLPGQWMIDCLRCGLDIGSAEVTQLGVET